jgi:DNA-binding NarL/FixJ family response regulator
MTPASRSHDRAMAENGIEHLRVLIANKRRDRLELRARVVAGLGHEVIAREIEVKEVGPVTAKEHPDVALVGLGLSSEHALELIGEIVREASCPVIALLSARDPAYVHEAASAASSPTSSTPAPKSCKARSTSPCNGSPSTTACRARSAVAR